MCHCFSSSRAHSGPRSAEAERSIRRAFLHVALLAALLASACPWVNAQDPSAVGQFSSVMSWPFNPTHAVLLPSGEVFWWGSFAYGGRPEIWSPITNANTAATQPGYNIFCGGHSLLESGQVLVIGGDAADSTGVANASTYDPVSGNWTFLPNMNWGRWYPTSTVLPNGDVVVTSGEISPLLGTNPLPQVWQVSSGTWRNLTTAQLLLPLYPPMYLAPNGTLFNASPVSRYLNTDGTGSWTVGPSMEYQARGYGPSVMYNNGQIMITGGGVGPTATAEIINLNDPAPTWSYTGTMAYARRHANATLLPDGTVLVTGGTSGVPFDDNTNPVYPAELWNPATGTWSTLASLSVYRGYHSVALLLPDGRVLSGGGQCYGDTNCNPNSAEIFSPAYLFAGARPTITSAPATISGGQTFFVATPDAANITQVTWIRLGAVTHTFNQEQRINFLSFSQATGGLNVTAPPSANLTPPGFYMLFLLSSGVPSVASIIQVDNSSFAQNGPAVSLSLTSLTFPATFVGSTTASKAVQLTNLGTTSVTINSVTAGADYTVTSNTCGSQLAPGSCTINVAFKPTTGGQLNEFLTINDSDSSSPQTVALGGLGKALKASLGTLNMGIHSIGASGTPLPVTFTNLGTTPINIGSIGYPNPEFSQYLPSSTCGASLPGLSACQVFSVFTPNAAGSQTGSLTVVDSDPSSPTTINLTGAGIALEFSSPNLIFGGLNLGLTHKPVSLTVTNLGPVTVNFSSIAIGGTDPADFGIQTNTCGAALGAGANCALGVTFTPQAAGARSATMIFADDSFNSPQSVSLGGTGIAVLTGIVVTPAQSSVAVGSTQQFTATGTYNNGTSNNITASATWSSSNTGVATISNTGGSQGMATGVAVGGSTITANVNSIKGSTSLAVQNATTTAVRGMK
jgi:galactose oxidase-like protein/Big-like domain-containing protein/HYDIN/CFA65/VesB family protein/Kelch motif protein